MDTGLAVGDVVAVVAAMGEYRDMFTSQLVLS